MANELLHKCHTVNYLGMQATLVRQRRLSLGVPAGRCRVESSPVEIAACSGAPETAICVHSREREREEDIKREGERERETDRQTERERERERETERD